MVSATGVGAGLGVNERNGLLLAEKTINAKGGFKGRPIRIIIEDDTSNPDTAVTKVNDLIFNQKVITVFGASLLGPAVAIGGITDTAKIPQLTFTGLGPAVELKRKCVFHMLPPHELNARGLYEYARSIGAKKVGVLHDTGYGNVVMREINNVAGDYKDIQVLGLEKYEMAATDATAQAAKLRALNPDAIFVIGTTATPFRAIRQLQMKQPIIAVNGASSYEVAQCDGRHGRQRHRVPGVHRQRGSAAEPEGVRRAVPQGNERRARRTSRRPPGTRCTSPCERSTRSAPMPAARSCARPCASPMSA